MLTFLPYNHYPCTSSSSSTILMPLVWCGSDSNPQPTAPDPEAGPLPLELSGPVDRNIYMFKDVVMLWAVVVSLKYYITSAYKHFRRIDALHQFFTCKYRFRFFVCVCGCEDVFTLFSFICSYL